LQEELFDLLREEDQEIRAERWTLASHVAFEAILVGVPIPDQQFTSLNLHRLRKKLCVGAASRMPRLIRRFSEKASRRWGFRLRATERVRNCFNHRRDGSRETTFAKFWKPSKNSPAYDRREIINHCADVCQTLRH
jgi:hypothetical protein